MCMVVASGHGIVQTGMKHKVILYRYYLRIGRSGEGWVDVLGILLAKPEQLR